MTRHRDHAWLLLPLFLALAAYTRVLDGEFQFDDFVAIEHNPGIKDLGRLVAETPLSGWIRAGRPIVDLTLALNYAAGALDPVGYHAVNLTIHLVAVVLVWFLTRRVSGLAGASNVTWIALAATGAFALHPLQTQAVSYVIQRAESLASALYVATILLLLEAERRGRSWGGALAWTFAFAAFVLALGSKQIAVTAPAAYLLVALGVAGTPAARTELTTWPRRLAFAAPIFAWAAAFAARAISALEGLPDAGFAVPDLSPRDYFLTQLRALVVYLRLLVWPSGQSADWSFPVSRTPWEPAVLASALVLVSIVAGTTALLVLGRRSPDARGAAARLAGLGLAWYFLVLSVTSSFVPVVDVLVEHRVYLASWGVFLAAAAGAERLAVRAPPRLAWSAVVVMLCLLAAVTWRRNAVWETREALWTDVLATWPGSVRARMNRGFALSEQGRYREAVSEYRVALAGTADVPKIRLKILRNLGSAHVFLREPQAAIAAYREGLAIAPDDPELLVGTGLVLVDAGDVAGAEIALRRALAVAPEQPTAWNVLGVLKLRRGEWAAALDAFDRAAVVNPDMGEVHANRAVALERLGRVAEGCAAWDEALRRRLAPRDRPAVEQAAARCRHRLAGG